jgi:hypothetical protein
MRVEVTVRQDGIQKTRYIDLRAFSISLTEFQELLALFFDDFAVKPVAMRAREV